MHQDKAECGQLSALLSQLGRHLDGFLRFDHPDAMASAAAWKQQLGKPAPDDGIGAGAVLEELAQWVIPNGSQIPYPGCTAFITTGATSVGALATLAGAVSSPQRIGLTAFNYLEEVSLQWLCEMFGLDPAMKGLYSSGGSVANLVALGGARQSAFEALGWDPARSGVNRPGFVYGSAECHHSIQRAAAVLGLGRESVRKVRTDAAGRMCPRALVEMMRKDASGEAVPIAIVANAGSTNHGAIDPLRELGEVAREQGIWFHVDGAYGLPGILDPELKELYDGLELADSVTVDPHKWLGAPVGIGATFVRDRELLNRAFTQEAANYLEGSCTDEEARHSMDNLGIPYADFGVELSAPPRGVVVWALLREIGIAGMRERVCRHNALARLVAERAREHPNLEVVRAPTLSICCFRYVADRVDDLNELNRRLHRKMVHRGRSIPSTTLVNGTLAIRPCFVGARTTEAHALELIAEVLDTGREVAREMAGPDRSQTR